MGIFFFLECNHSCQAIGKNVNRSSTELSLGEMTLMGGSAWREVFNTVIYRLPVCYVMNNTGWRHPKQRIHGVEILA